MHRSFPVIEYNPGDSPYTRGVHHGEEYKEGIRELAHIRRDLMIAKNPGIRKQLSSLAQKQFSASCDYDEDLSRELEGIAAGAGCSLEDIVVLNNYTDFRDLHPSEEGCSTVYIRRKNFILSGQTWDMHASAKDYVCVIRIPGTQKHPGGVFFSLVGCLGMMGVNTRGHFMGVNNINTKNARPGVIWPVVVRKCLLENDLSSMKKMLLNTPVTSGHNYLLSDGTAGLHLEATPDIKEEVAGLSLGEGEIIHTNHCLGQKTRSLEVTASVTSTSHIRYELLKDKSPLVKDFEGLINLLRNHDNYPKSICSHFESGIQDPSMTCGGGAFEFNKRQVVLWKGCEKYDTNFKEYRFQLAE